VKSDVGTKFQGRERREDGRFLKDGLEKKESGQNTHREIGSRRKPAAEVQRGQRLTVVLNTKRSVLMTVLSKKKEKKSGRNPLGRKKDLC